MTGPLGRGTLYVVSTPIGNLEDISIRAVSTLSGADLIAAEDTRTTKVLLSHYGIRKPLVSYHSYNETRRIPHLITRLLEGASIALVSDAGTPGISDPALRIILAALEAGIAVRAVPGASALLSALIVSGSPAGRFSFEGFLPAKKGRRARLERLRDEEGAIVLYESPHRILRTLAELKEVLGDREVAVSRELTKKFEETLRGTPQALLERFNRGPIRGEFVIVISPKT
jgi:16S rRNA (cytidine1402-2'-O)-methyltransferase